LQRHFAEQLGVLEYTQAVRAVVLRARALSDVSSALNMSHDLLNAEPQRSHPTGGETLLRLRARCV